MKVYLAGPMRGIPQFNFPAFKVGADALRAQGHEVFSPAEKDIERHGEDISVSNEAGSEEEATVLFGFSIREALGEDLAWICAEAEVVALLPDWENSRGAKAEKATAEALGIEVWYLAYDGSIWHKGEQ